MALAIRHLAEEVETFSLGDSKREGVDENAMVSCTCTAPTSTEPDGGEHPCVAHRLSAGKSTQDGGQHTGSPGTGATARTNSPSGRTPGDPDRKSVV